MPQRFHFLFLFVILSSLVSVKGYGQCGTLAITGAVANPVSCNGGSDGSITLNITGGTGPFTYSNGTSTTGSALVSTQAFNSDVVTSNSTTTQFYSPICNNGRYFDYSSSVGCPSGSAYFSSQSGIGYDGCFLRTPQRDASGLNAVTLRFDISHSYNAGRPLDKITFSIWINNGYRNTTVVPVTVNGVATNEMAFTQSRTCETVEVVFNISSGTLADKSDMFLYINSSCGYSNCGSYWVALDNVEVLQGGGSSYQSSSTFNNLSVGNYTVSVQDANGCILTYASNPVVVTQPTALTASVSHINPTTVGGSNGKAWVTASGGTGPYTYHWNTGISGLTDTLTNLSAGNYCVTVVDANNCTVSSCATVTNPTCTLAITSIGKVNASCAGVSNGSFAITTSGANGAVEYSINGGTNWQSSNSFTNLAAGNYTVQVRDAAGCTASASGNPQVITAPQVMSLNFAVTPVSTVGGNDGAINLTVTGGNTPTTYMWNTGATPEDITGLGAGQYCVTVTDALGCTITGCGNVTSPVCSLAVTSVVATSACGNNGSITVTSSGANGAVEYTINGGTTWQASGTFGNLSAGSYTVQARDAAGCTANAPANPYTLTQPAAIGLNFVATPVSTAGGSDGTINLTVSNAAPPVSFQWSTGAVNQNLNGLAAGQYCVTVTDNNGCTATGCENVTQPGCSLAIANIVKQNVDCFGNANGSIVVTATGGVGNVEYSINGGTSWSASGNFTGLAPGNYTVQVRDGNGCFVIANGNPYVVSQPTTLFLSIANVSNVSQAGANDGSIDLTVSGGTPPYTFIWSNSAFTQNIGNLAAGTYCVTVTDANGCEEVTCGTVTAPGNPCPGFAITNVVATQPLCPGDNGTITISISGGQNPILYSIGSGATFQNGLSQFTVSGGSYDVLVRDDNGCEAVYANNPVVINTPQTLNPIAVANGFELSVNNIGVSYQWLFGGNVIADADSTHYTVIANGTYSVEVTDANGCVFTSNTITVTGVGIEEILGLQWQVWPNPIEQIVNYAIDVAGNQAQIEVWSSDGRLVQSYAVSQPKGEIDLAVLPGGVYNIRLVTAQGQAIKRIVKY